jgi:hypothetical protein
MPSGLERRLEKLERDIFPGVLEILVHGGLPDTDPRRSAVWPGGSEIRAAPDEPTDSFVARVHAAASQAGADMIAFGGLPNGAICHRD